MKIKRWFVSLLLLTLVLATGCETLLSSNSSSTDSVSSGFKFNNEEFDNYLDDLFVELLRGSPLDINYLLRYPEKYGLENEKASPVNMSLEANNEYKGFITQVISDLNSFNDEDLSAQQILDKKVVLDALSNELCMANYYYYQRPLSSTLGYQAQLPLILAEYRFDDVKDINNYFDIIEYLPQSFASIIDFEKEKIEQGLGLNDTLIDSIIVQIDNLLSAEENFLIPVFNDKINSVTPLDKSRDSYINEHKDIIDEYFIPAYEYLKEELTKLKGSSNIYGGLSLYENGQAYFVTLFKNDVGVNFNSIEEVKSQIDEAIEDTFDDFVYLATANPSVISQMQTYDFSLGKNKEQIIEFLIEESVENFPSLVTSNLRYEFKQVHPSMQETSSPAFYMISAIDDNAKEVIYINPLSVNDDNNYLYNVISHEGIPGHLYQHVYFKNSKAHPIRHLFSFSGYTEGWAKYVEDYTLNYTSSSQALAKAVHYNNIIYYLMLVRCDIGINYDSWTKKQMSDYISRYFTLPAQSMNDLYDYFVENPVNASTYYYSYYQFYSMKEYMRSKMGNSKYKDYDFHELVLDTGPSSFKILKEEIDKYIAKVK